VDVFLPSLVFDIYTPLSYIFPREKQGFRKVRLGMEILDHISFSLELDEIGETFHLKGTQNEEEIQILLDVAESLITAKALYTVCYVESKTQDTVIIEGIRFESRVLRMNLEKVERVFPYAITIGPKLEKKVTASEDFLEQYYLDAIGNMALNKARQFLENHLKTRFALGGMSYMSPGSLQDWPLEAQEPLFSILGNTEASIGLRLDENLTMVPRKSLSGIYFPTETTFYSCQLCPRKQCNSRKAPYDKKLAREYGLLNRSKA
jgi:hypothetical protein